MDGKTWRPVDKLSQRDYMRLYDPDEYNKTYALEIGATQPRLFT